MLKDVDLLLDKIISINKVVIVFDYKIDVNVFFECLVLIG